jgi:predicted regulator of Ras-like GTPase activity (Roadblock/LC7/MglB family)
LKGISRKLGETQTILSSQIETATLILQQLKDAISPEYLGLVTTAGQPISVISSTKLVDSDSVASLAASSFAASQLLASMVKDSAHTVMLHEGDRLNIHIARVSSGVLLVVCFHRSSDIGRVRLITKRAVDSLGEVFNIEGE